MSKENSWVILSELEARIKAKIEAVGTPLKDWDIQINYGIKTGFNEAFIIDDAKRKELLKNCPEADAIIRPILKGRSIKKYVAKVGDFIILLPCGWTNSNRGNMDPLEYFKNRYPAIYLHFIEKGSLVSKGKGLFNRDDQGDYWWELRPCAYLNRFKAEKIIYIDIMTDNEAEGYPFPCFSYSHNQELILNTAYFLSGKPSDLKFFLAVLNSPIGRFIVKTYVTQLQQRQYRLFQQNVETFPIPSFKEKTKKELATMIDRLFENKELGKEMIEIENIINRIIFSSYNFSVEEQEAIINFV
ncbi:MAG TPA: TaqI-like C-terminal specificity domain-containing protein [Sphingobacteriaceae bacterium]|nr:TaqI-like C-terminal specificity domain-containing protein [Sphingobacteriaceae bacterium]